MAAFAADRRDGLEQGDELGDAVAVPAGQGGGKRNAVASVIRWCLLPVVCFYQRAVGHGFCVSVKFWFETGGADHAQT